MNGYLMRSASIGAVLAVVVAASALAKTEVFRAGNLFIRDSGGISPTKLPKHKKVPVSARLNARLGTIDGSHPPALKRVVANFDRTIQVNARGLPACRRNALENRTTKAAKLACRNSIVGSGKGEVEVEFPDQAPFTAKSPVTLFNGGVRRGTTLLLIHAYLAVPAPTSVVVPVKITRIRRGRYGIHADARIPRIAGGFGSVTHFQFIINRRFTFKRKKRSYLTASCPTGRYFAKARVLTTDGTSLRVTHVFPCTPRD